MVIPNELVTKESTLWDDAETIDELGEPITSADWTLKYEFRGAASVSLTAATNGTGWRTTVLVSSFTTPGTYYWQAILTQDDGAMPTPVVTKRKVLSSGRLVVKANLADQTATFDGRTPARMELEAVQLAMHTLIAGGVKSYTIGTRSLTKMDLPDLLLMESRLKAIVAREEKAEKIAAGLGNPNNLFIRFNR